MIDFHCHLDLYPDPEKAARDANAAGIYVLSVTTTPKAWHRTADLARGYKRIRTALGLHPQIAHERYRELALFEALLPLTKYVGEIGLDGTPDSRKHAPVQKMVFETITRACAVQNGRILSIHSRRAVDDVLDCLSRQTDAGVPVLHWFSGTKGQLRRAAEQGCWFSVGPPMLRTEKGRALVAEMPEDRVLTETDGPFTTNGTRPLEPSDSSLTTPALSKIWHGSSEDVEHRLADNLKRLVNSVSDVKDNKVRVSGLFGK